MAQQQRHGDTVRRHLTEFDGQGNVTSTPCHLYWTAAPRRAGGGEHRGPGWKYSFDPLIVIT